MKSLKRTQLCYRRRLMSVGALVLRLMSRIPLVDMNLHLNDRHFTYVSA